VTLTDHDAAAVRAALDWPSTISALRSALLGDLDPENEPRRTSHPFGTGDLLVMPSTGKRYCGVKLATVAPDNAARGLPRISAVFTLFDASTLTPVATLDGTALTHLRTPAVSALGVELVAAPDAARLIVFGTGPQAYGHVHAIDAVRPLSSVDVVGRDPERTAALVTRLAGEGYQAASATPADVADADVVACCTTGRAPLFDGTRLAPHAVVVACGSHEPDAREVDGATAQRGGVAVESVASALAEAGDVVLALDEGAITRNDLVTLSCLVRGTARTRPKLVKTVGMGWEDLAVAVAVVEALAPAGAPA
jgi:ornithine cyclodeaminase/alanine dehydrogenase-like protein (mu-crystallin family)